LWYIPIPVFAIYPAPGYCMVIKLGIRGALLIGFVIAAVGTLKLSGETDKVSAKPLSV
jgi:hypothetical protein